MHSRRLFIASCIALVTSAFTFGVRGEILEPLGSAFNLSKEHRGMVEAAVFYGMTFSMLVGGPLCDLLGMKRIMGLAFLCHLLGISGTMFAPECTGKLGLTADQTFWWLFSASFLMGCGNGMVETAINPLIATVYSHDKTHYLNILHAWWPGGLIIGGLAVSYLGDGINLGFGSPYTVGDQTMYGMKGLNLALFGMTQWQTSLLLILIPCLIYGVMVLPERFPVTERVAAGVSYGEMFLQALRPGFLLLAFCMILTASTELGPQKWQNSVLPKIANVSGTIILVYTSGIMFIMRHFAGPLARAISPVGILLVSSLLSGIGLYLLSFANNAATAFGYATIFGIGIAYFWPTMLGVTAERFPKGGALLICLIGAVGNLGVALTQTQMGVINDHYAVMELRAKDDALANDVVKEDQVNPLAKWFKQTALHEPPDRAARAEAIEPDRVKAIPKDSPSIKIINDAEKYGAAWMFRWVSILPAVLVVLFGLMWLTDRARGGYKAVSLSPGGH